MCGRSCCLVTGALLAVGLAVWWQAFGMTTIRNLEEVGGGEAFYNWAGTVEVRARTYAAPASEAEVIDLIKSARAVGDRIKVVGAGHS